MRSAPWQTVPCSSLQLQQTQTAVGGQFEAGTESRTLRARGVVHGREPPRKLPGTVQELAMNLGRELLHKRAVSRA